MILLTAKLKKSFYFLSLVLFFSLFYSLVLAAAPTADKITPSSGSSVPGIAKTFTCVYSDRDGWANIKETYLLISLNSTSLSYAVYLYYDQDTNLLYLRDDDNSNWLGGYAPGSPNIVENSSVTLNCALTSVVGSRRTLSVKYTISFKSQFSGQAYSTYLKVADNQANLADWVKKGTYTINQSPSVGTISPVSGSGATNIPVIFAATYQDLDGWQNIKIAQLLINSSIKLTNCFVGYYDAAANKLFLRNNANKAWIGGYAPGSQNVIENSYVKLDCSQSSVSNSGNILTVNWAITFKPAFLGAKKSYLYVKDNLNAYQNWAQAGSWTIFVDSTAPTGSISINNNSSYTNNTAVTLTLNAADTGGSGVSQMQFSNDNLNWTAPEAYSVSKEWSLENVDGIKTVYVKFSDNSGNWSLVYQDTITLDTAIIAPTLGSVTTPTRIATQSLNGTKETDTSIWVNGVEAISINQETSWTYTINLTEGDNNFSITSKDAAGNESSPITGKIVLDTTPPSKPLALNGTPADSAIDISWASNPENDLAGYNVYRSLTSGVGYNKLNVSLINGTAFKDLNIQAGTMYYYVVTSVDNLGNESGYSGEVTVTAVSLATEIEPNNDFSSANQLPLDTAIKGTINPIGDQDYYKINISKPDKLLVFLSNVPANIIAHVFFYNSSKQEIFNKSVGTPGENISLAVSLNNAGEYYMRVVSDNGTNSSLEYSLSVNIAKIWFISDSRSPNPFSPNEDSVYDTTNIKASTNLPCNWKIRIKDAFGNVIRGFNGKGTDIDVHWDGKDLSGNIQPDNIYTYNIFLFDPQTGLFAFGIKRKIQIDTKIDSAVISNVSGGQTISGKFDIKGEVFDLNYDYSSTAIYYGKGTAPSEWMLIKQLYSPVEADSAGNPQLIATWNTSNLSNGDYIMRLVVKDKAGNQKTTEVPVKIYNLSIYNVLCRPNIISPNNDGFYDTATITAALSLEAGWTVNIKDASGSILRSITGTGINVEASWDGKDLSGNTVADGPYSYEISATDPISGGTFSPTLGTIQIDTKIDSAVISNVTAGQAISGKIDVRGIADDINFSSYDNSSSTFYSALYYGYGNSIVSWTIIGSYFKLPVKTDDLGNAQILQTWDTTLLPNGDYSLRLVVNDAGGNQKNIDIPVTLNNISIYSAQCRPRIFSPNSDGIVDSTLIDAYITELSNWQINIKDSSGVSVRVFSGTGLNISVVWDGRNEGGDIMADGVYSYTIDAQDIINNQPAKQRQGNMEIDTTLPAAEFISPVNGAEITGVTQIEGQISDKNFTTAQLYYKNETTSSVWYPINSSCITTSSGIKISANWDTASGYVTLANGSYTLRLTASDAAGNSKNSDINVSLFNNNISNLYVSPKYISPNADGLYDKSYILAFFHSINNWVLTITDSSGSKIRSYSGSSSSINVTWDGKDESGNTVSDAAYTYTINGSDVNTGKSAAPVQGNIVVDNTLPAASITNPSSGASLNGTIAIKGTAIDTNFLSVYLGYGTGTSPTSWNYLYFSNTEQTGIESILFTNWDTNNIANGDYTLRLIVTDLAGNKKTVDSPLAIANAEPDITELTVSPVLFTPDGLDDDITNDITNISFKLSAKGYVNAAIYDKNNVLTKTLCAGALYPDPLNNMKMEFTWDGRDNSGKLARNGEYKVVVSTGTKQQNASVMINDRPIFNDTSVSPESFSPNGDNIFDTTAFSFSLSEDSVINVEIYNFQNELVKIITSEMSANAGKINSLVWDGKDINNQTCPSGQYFMKVNAIAVTGSIAPPLILNVYILPVSNIRISSDIINPYLNATVQISYYLAQDAKLSIKIYDSKSNLIKNLVTDEARATGEHNEIWDGKDNSGYIPSDDYYYFTIEDTSGGIAEKIYDPQNTGGKDISHSINVTTTRFDTLQNQYCSISYITPKPAKITIKARSERYSGPAVRVIKYQEPVGNGQHQAIWDGRDEAGNIVSQRHYYIVAVWGYTLPDNAILITGGKPVISDVSIMPIRFNPNTNPYSKTGQESSVIAFALSKESYVTVDIYNSENILVYKLLDNVLKLKGQNSVTWNGKNSNNEYLPNGYYRVDIQAQDNGNYSDVITAHTEVVY